MNAPQVNEKTPNGLEILIERYRSDEGKLSCSNSFKVL
jgi:hypothetical protein